MRIYLFALALVVPVGCVDRPLQQTTSEQPPGTSTGEESETGGGESGEGTDSGGPATGSMTTGGGTTGATSSTSTAGSSGSDVTTEGVETNSSGGSSSGGGGPPSSCGPPCAETWEHFGSLDVTGARDLSCLTRVHGDLWLTEFSDLAVGATLGNLVQVDGRVEFGHPDLTDLSMLGCLEQTEWLIVQDSPQLVDASLPALKSARWIELEGTAMTALPTFAPDYQGIERLNLFNNPDLVDLSPGSGWQAASDTLMLVLDDNAKLTSLAGLGPLLASPTIDLQVQLTDHPALTSLAGLEDVTHATLYLAGLPALANLDALKKLSSGSVTLIDIPKVTDLSGLSGLTVADTLMIGDCINMGSGGMDGLTSLAGLDNLTSAVMLAIANNKNMSSLTGAPKLTSLGNDLAVVNNPALSQDDFDQLMAQLTEPASDSCFGDWGECQCYEILPW